jgi:hypothetical protein
MSEPLADAYTAPLPEDEFEGRLFKLIETRAVHFPKALVMPPRRRAWPWRAMAALFGRRPIWRRPVSGVLVSPALAYVLVLVLLIPAYRGLVPRGPKAATPPPSAPPAAGETAGPGAEVAAPVAEPAAAGARTFDLGAGVTRASTGRIHVVPEETDAFVVLRFLVPIRERAGDVYEAVLSDGAGRTVAVQRPLRSRDALGNFVLVCRREVLREGSYVLHVSLLGAPAETWLFPFEVVRPAR